MRIGYIANHGCGGNDDEGAIAHALRELGHDVQPLRESRASQARNLRCDVVLFHKWEIPERLHVPSVFWYFDLVDFPDPSLAGRNKTRLKWMRNVLPRVDIGFCTDGDWVNADTTGKLVYLPQGADERVVGRASADVAHRVLFTGIRAGGGRGRVSFVDEMAAKYGNSFYHVSKGVHGRAMAELIAQSHVVVAPDSPVTDRYWSNRVFNVLGFGGFLMHPHCKGLTEFYEDGKELLMYRSREELHKLIESASPAQAEAVARAGLERTMREHLYRHRCEKMVQIIKERLHV